MKFFLLGLSLCLSFSAQSSIEIYNLKTQKIISFENFVKETSPDQHFVMGEFHYDKKIHKVQGQIVEQIVEFHHLENSFTLGWEFLNGPDQEAVSKAMQEYKDNKIDGDILFKKFFKNSNHHEENLKYLPVMEAVKNKGGQFLALNAPRPLKRIIVKEGIQGLDPKEVPPRFELGGEFYYARFKKVMSGHVSEEKLKKYYQAQCFTDSVMAHNYNLNAKFTTRFTVVGAFHSDFSDGYVHELKKYTGDDAVVLKIVNAENLDEEEIAKMIKGDAIYGEISDYLFIVK